MIITIGNNKGGTGKTTVATHLSVALSKLNKKVLLIDNDTQCNASRLMTRNPKSHLGDLLNPATIDEPCNLSDFISSTSFDDLWCLPNSLEASGLGIFFAQKFPDSLYYLRRKIRDQALNKFDFVIIDCPPTLDTTFGMALCASDAVIVPVEVGSVHSLDGLVQVLKLVEEMQNLNTELTFMKLIMNKSDMRTVVTKSIIAQIKENYADMHFNTILPVCTAIQQAEFFRKTLFTHSPTSTTIPKYKSLAKEVVEASNGR